MPAFDYEILDSLAKIIPSLTHVQKEKLLHFFSKMSISQRQALILMMEAITDK